MTHSIIVLDGEQRSALSIVRSLGRQGHTVHVGSCVRHSLAGGSRAARSETLLPDPLDDADAYSEAVARLVHDCQGEVLLPVTEASTLAILERRDLFPNVRIPTSDISHFRRASDKAAVLSLARGLGIDVPAQWIVSPEEGSTPSIPLEAFPVAVKPSRSVLEAADGRRKAGVAYAGSLGQLEQLIEEFGIEARPLLIQSKIIGPGLGVFLLRWDGEFMASFAHRRLREKPPSGGVSVCSESVVVPASLLAQSELLLSELDWTGVAMVEFKRDDRSGRTFLMEVNPRFWGSLQLSIDAGVDFPRYLVELALGDRVRAVHSWRVGVRSRWWWGDVDHLLARLRHSKRDLDLPPESPGLLKVALDVLSPWRRHQRGDVFRPSDPRPALREAIEWFRALA